MDEMFKLYSKSRWTKIIYKFANLDGRKLFFRFQSWTDKHYLLKYKFNCNFCSCIFLLHKLTGSFFKRITNLDIQKFFVIFQIQLEILSTKFEKKKKYKSRLTKNV